VKLVWRVQVRWDIDQSVKGAQADGVLSALPPLVHCHRQVEGTLSVVFLHLESILLNQFSQNLPIKLKSFGQI
jgi:hypothetical protein